MPIFAGNCPVLAMVAPVSIAAGLSANTGWFDVRNGTRIRALVAVGAGGGTPAISWQQANTAAGGGAKALPAWGVGTFASSRIDVDNPQPQLDLNNGFGWVMGTVTVTGGTGTITAMLVMGEDGNAA
jgi:hypothetical protein